MNDRILISQMRRPGAFMWPVLGAAVLSVLLFGGGAEREPSFPMNPKPPAMQSEVTK